MLSGVLRSKRAIMVNTVIMRAFVKLREMPAVHKDLANRLDNLEQKYDAKFRVIFDAIRKPEDAPGIGRLFIRADLPMIDRAGVEEIPLPASAQWAAALLQEIGPTDADRVVLPTTVASGTEESCRPAGSAAPIVVMPASGPEEATAHELGALAWMARMSISY